jgi:hypothetical protein
MRRRLELLKKRFPDAQVRALYQEAQIEMTESKKRVPVDTGTLRSSGHVVKPVTLGTRTTVDLVYGGAAEEYAVIVHENLGALHEVGQAKYLESVLMQSAPHMARRIAARVKFNEEMMR